ncbi:MAG: hypothetical protein AAF433_21280 [Bacteroidota bacterium]
MRNAHWWLLLAALLLLVFSQTFCAEEAIAVAISDIEQQPKATEADAPFASVYLKLDGSWQGEFLIYRDPSPQALNGRDLEAALRAGVDYSQYELMSAIQVEQLYHSISPYFQEVQITDYYPETGDTIRSRGVNKIQDGQMWCVVQKPDELIIHRGSREGDNGIIWQRNEKEPQRIEYFLETVGPRYYEISGYGYYEGDDPDLSPPLWFYSRYERK